MAQKYIASYLRTYRKKSGLTQREVANLLGYPTAGPVSRHERGVRVPSLSVALAYQALFQIPVTKLFPTMQDTAKRNIETRISNLGVCLGTKSVRDRDAAATARKLQFIAERNDSRET